MPINVRITTPDYDQMYKAFDFDPKKTVDENVRDLKAIYAMTPLSIDVLKTALGSAMNNFDLSDFTRSREEQERCAKLSAAAQDLIARSIVNQKAAEEELLEDVGTRAKGRFTSFLRHDHSDASRKYNMQINEVFKNSETNPEATVRLRYDSIDQARKELNLNGLEDMIRLFYLSDQDFVENFESFYRFARMIAESEHLHESDYLTPEEQDHIRPYIDVGMQLLGIMGKRLDVIANPYYATLDPDRLYAKNPDLLTLNETLEDMERTEEKLGIDFGRDSATFHALPSYFNSQTSYAGNRNTVIKDTFDHLDPNMKGAVWGVDQGYLPDALSAFKPVVARTQSGVDMVVTNSLYGYPKAEPALDYAKQLSERAAKADRFLLTGSKEFALMRRAMDAFIKAQAEKASNDELSQKAEAAIKATKDYLQHKQDQGRGNFSKEFDSRTFLHAGKNQREQSRLDIAADYLKYATAHRDTVSKVIDIEKAPPEPPLSPAEKSAKEKVDRNLAFTNQEKDFANNINKLTKQKAPTEAVAENADPLAADPKEIMTQDEFDALCTMACSSKEATYQRKEPVKDAQGNFVIEMVKVKVSTRNKETGKPEVVEREERQHVKQMVTKQNNDPDKLYGELLNSIQLGNTVLGHADGMIRGVSRSLSAQLSQKNFEMSGRMLADGIRMNNKIMQGEKGFTSKFDTCARLNEKALQMLEKYPQLSSVVKNHLDPQDLAIARNGQALYNVHREGIKAQQDLISRCSMEDFSNAVNENKADVAKICHMYDAERKYATKQLKLDTIDLATYSKNTQGLREALQNNQTINDFVNDLNGKTGAQRINLVGNPHKMGTLFGEAAQNQKQVNDIQNRPTFEYQLQVGNAMQQGQVQQPQAQPMVQTNPMG